MTPRKNEQRGRLLGRTALMIAAVAAVALVGLAQKGRSEPKGTDPARDRVLSRQRYTKPPVEQLHRSLTPLQFEVTQREATEPPFGNAFWDNHERGLYVDVATGEPLFSSTDKFESGTGWPSFTRPVEVGRVVERRDTSAGMLRAEVRSQGGDSHLGHVFDDGPAPTHLRYCINSAALRFIPAAKLAPAGYGAYAPLFADASAAPAATPTPSTTAAMSPAAAAPSVAGSASPTGGADTPTPNNCTLPGSGGKPGCTPTLETAILAGGCFWGMEDILRKIPGVVQTQVGYTGGTLAHPTYEDVHTGETGHAESVRIVFDPRKLSYADLLEKWFFRMHDPTTRNRQGNDVGSQYRSAIFVTSPAQRRTAEAAKVNAAKTGRWKSPIVTEIVDAGPFTLAEAYHQKYLEQNPGGYTCHYLRN